MCGRFTLQSPADLIANLFEMDDVEIFGDLAPRYNIAPTQKVLSIHQEKDGDAEVQASLMRWGLIPFFAKDLKIGARMINARSETAHEKPSFRRAFKSQRCLIPADGFYEWKKTEDGQKTPTYIKLKSGGPFAMAGLYETWKAPDQSRVVSCTILTTEPNEFMAPIHNRMPVILDPKDFGSWLDPKLQDREYLRSMLQACDEDLLLSFPVSKLVNSPRNDDPTCCRPV